MIFDSPRGKSLLPHLGFWTALASVVAMGWVLHRATLELRSSSAWVEHTHKVLETIGAVDEQLSRAEAMHRGYLISLDDQLLAERDQSLRELDSAASSLTLLVTDNESQRTRAALLQQTVAKRGAMLKDSSLVPAAESAGIVTAGAVVSAELRGISAALRAEEQRLLGARREAEMAVHERIGRLLLASAALALLIIVPSFLAFFFESRARRRVEGMLREMAGSVPGAIYRCRVTAHDSVQFEYLSPNVTSLTDIDSAAAYRDPSLLWNSVVEADREGLTAAYACARETTSPLHHDFRIATAAGDIRWIRSSAAPSNPHNGTIVWNGHWADVTAQKELEAALNGAKEAADSANRAKSTFLAVMSHEIRTPMNGVLGLLELLALTTLDADQRRIVSVIRESGRSLQRIIDDILDFSKIEAGKLDIAPVPASVREVVASTRNMYSGNASSKGLVLKCTVADDVSPAHVVDPLRLGQILNNLTSNAIKFTNEGLVEISVRGLSQREGVETLRFDVTDSGIGMSAEAQARLFRPFTQASDDTAHTYGGTGLGLSISKRLAEMMGGSIEVRSDAGAGTTMSVTLPLRIADPAELPAIESSDSPDAAGEVRHGIRSAPTVEQAEREGTLVLVVDDHPTNRMLMCRQMNVLGYAAETASNGLEALDKWKSGRFALLVTDCNMPDMDGYELSHLIRRLEGMRGAGHTPIVACTANALRGEAEKCLAAGMDDYLSKPVQVSQLALKLHQWLPLPEAPAGTPEPHAHSTVRAPEGGQHDAIDRSVLAQTSGGDALIEREILDGFLEATAFDIAELNGAIDRSDLAASKRAAHRIKGAAAMVGAVALAEHAAKAEGASAAGEIGAVRGAAVSMTEEIDRVKNYVQGLRTSGA